MMTSIVRPTLPQITRFCNLEASKYIGAGGRAWGVYMLADGQILKLYSGRDSYNPIFKS